MSWPTVALLLLGCAVLGALLGAAPSRVRTGWLVAAAVLAAFFVFLPGVCASAIAASADDLQQGTTSCRFVYGPAVPELGALDGDGTGRVLQLTGALLAVASVLLVRRRAAGRRPETDQPA